MDQKLFDSEDSVLFVGEGNFSFSLSFIETKNYCVKHVTTTCFTNDNHSNVTLVNIKKLTEAGVNVQVGIDATKLTTYTDIIQRQFTCIIFNFPHVGGKMKINKNRTLLKDFFASCAALFALNRNEKNSSHKILISLCKGQGGTPADGEHLRAWGDSWQIIEMAALSGLVLCHVEPFCPNLCPGYSSVGYRSRENWFHTEKALVHVFRRSVPILVVSSVVDTDTLVTLETPTGNIFCERIYMEYAGFIETQSEYFLKLSTETSLELSLFCNLYTYLAKIFQDLEFLPPSKLPIHSDSRDSKVPCILNYNVASWLRSNFFELIECVTANIKSATVISHGPVFQAVSEDFNEAPARQQAVIHTCEVKEITSSLLLWISETLNITKSDLKIKNEKCWLIYYEDMLLAEKRDCSFAIELSTLAKIKYKISSFRDLLHAKFLDNKCIFASLYPRTHVLDICFLEGPKFTEEKLWTFLWQTLSHWIIKVELLDTYCPKDENWVSRCYRIKYRSSLEALSRTAAIQLHQSVLPELLLNSALASKVL